MIFAAITKQASTYDYGNPVGEDRFEQFGGVKIFFYELNSIQKEFKDFALTNADVIIENCPFYLIRCKKWSVLTRKAWAKWPFNDKGSRLTTGSGCYVDNEK